MPTVFIYWSPGRTREQKVAVIEEVTETLVERGGAKREDVLVIFQDIQAGDFGRGGVVAAPFQQDKLNRDLKEPE
jgi:4-oxalocrotonate tautomerase family enzyme